MASDKQPTAKASTVSSETREKTEFSFEHVHQPRPHLQCRVCDKTAAQSSAMMQLMRGYEIMYYVCYDCYDENWNRTASEFAVLQALREQNKKARHRDFFDVD